MNIGSLEIAIVAALTLILFGPTRMAELLRSMGKMTRQARRALSDAQAELDEATRVDDSRDTKTKR